MLFNFFYFLSFWSWSQQITSKKYETNDCFSAGFPASVFRQAKCSIIKQSALPSVKAKTFIIKITINPPKTYYDTSRKNIIHIIYSILRPFVQRAKFVRRLALRTQRKLNLRQWICRPALYAGFARWTLVLRIYNGRGRGRQQRPAHSLHGFERRRENMVKASADRKARRAFVVMGDSISNRLRTNLCILRF